MRRSLRRLIALLLAVLALPLARPLTAPLAAQDSAAARDTVAEGAARRDALQRAQRLVNDGFGTEGRAIVDSLLNRTEPRSAAEAEILFWRATLAPAWDAAQRDYLRVMLEHDRSVFAAPAMLRLAQGELTRGDREAALRYLERLAREAPNSAVRAEAGLWHGRLLVETGARAEGCGMLETLRPRVAPESTALARQYDAALSACASTAGAAPAAQPTPPPAAAAAERALVWSVQIAAFQTHEEATAFAIAMRDRGYETRVDGIAAPFRVRFGYYPQRAAASAAMDEYQRRERADAFLTQVERP